MWRTERRQDAAGAEPWEGDWPKEGGAGIASGNVIGRAAGHVNWEESREKRDEERAGKLKDRSWRRG